MTSPRTDPRLLDRLDSELRDVTRAVERIRHELTAMRPPPPPPLPLWRPAPPPVPPAGLAWAPPAPPPPVRAAPRSRQGLGARLLAATGGAVTLVGIVLLLVLAARGGWFGPVVQVVAGGVLGLGLSAGGMRLRQRYPTGAVALVATGVAALYLDLAAATVVHDLVPAPVTLTGAMLVLASGLLVADRWSTPGLAVGTVAGLAALVPVVADPSPGAVAVLLAAAVVPVALLAWRRGWHRPVLVAAVAVALFVLVGGVRLASHPATALVPVTVAALVLVVAAVGLALAGPVRLARGPRAALVAVCVPPILLTSGLLGRWGGVAVAGVVAIALLAVARTARHRGWSDPATATQLEAAAAVVGFTATALALDGASLAMLLLAQTVVLAVTASATGRRGPLVAALAYGLVGLVVALHDALPPPAVTGYGDPAWLAPSGRAPLVTAVATAVLLAAAAVTTVRAALAAVPGTDRAARWLVAGALGTLALYGAASAVVASALLVSPTRAAFLTGHVLVTVSWTALALLLLVRGLRDSTPRVLGAVLVVAAVTKLIVFDLVALDGIAGVAAFLGAGLVLLVAGTRYASLVAREAAQSEQSEQACGKDGAPVRSGAGCG